MVPSVFPAELVGGPKDGQHVQAHVPWWEIARMPQLDHFDLTIPKTPIRIETGRYEARRVGQQYVVSSQGWYLFDWKGWPS